MNCIACGVPMAGPRRGYWFACPRCGYLGSTLEPAIGDAAVAEALDEDHRRDALHGLRRRNFERILDVLESIRPKGGTRLLDVGCAHGWFLEAARARGYEALGLEPDAAIAAATRARSLEVIDGYFPDALPAGRRFDVISFNDVFEHLPDPLAAVRACFDRLEPGGLLVMNLPTSTGALFRIARALDRVGVSGPMDRLWQRGLPSPHLSYFSPDVLRTVLERGGFRELHRSSLVTFTREGLWQRLRADRNASLPGSLVAWLGLSAITPIAGLMPSDISLQVFARAGA